MLLTFSSFLLTLFFGCLLLYYQMLTVITSTVDPEVFEDLPVKMEEMQPRPPSIGAYLLLDILGIGEFGKVKLGKHIKTSQEVGFQVSSIKAEFK